MVKELWDFSEYLESPSIRKMHVPFFNLIDIHELC